MSEHEKALEAAKVIREYCHTKSCGTDCIFMELKDIWGFKCNLCDVDVPEFWDLSKAEIKCAESSSSVCGTTGLECIRCNPGACDHRKGKQ